MSSFNCSLSKCSARLWYFSSSVFLTTIYPNSLLVYFVHHGNVWRFHNHRILARSCSTTFGRVSRFDQGVSSPNLVEMSTLRLLPGCDASILCDVPGCLSWILPVVVDPGFSCIQSLYLCCVELCLCALAVGHFLVGFAPYAMPWLA